MWHVRPMTTTTFGTWDLGLGTWDNCVEEVDIFI